MCVCEGRRFPTYLCYDFQNDIHCRCITNSARGDEFRTEEGVLKRTRCCSSAVSMLCLFGFALLRRCCFALGFLFFIFLFVVVLFLFDFLFVVCLRGYVSSASY